MRKNIILLILLLCSASHLPGQADVFYSAPSAGSLPSYVNSPASAATGIPDINFPFLSLPTHNKNVTIETGISYHPNNTGRHNKASDVGLGWMLYGTGGVIYREINPFSSLPTDLYYYNLPGRSGKFTFAKNLNTNMWQLHKLGNDKLKIAFEPSGTDFKFTITDEAGTAYLFDTRDKSYNKAGSIELHYAGAYYLTKITDIQQQDLVTFTYQEDHFTVPGKYAGTTVPVKSLRANTIASPSFGSIIFHYSTDPSLRTSINDHFRLDSIELKTTTGKIIQKYGFQYQNKLLYLGTSYSTFSGDCAGPTSLSKRILKKIFKYDRTGVVQTTEFSYDHPEFPVSYWPYSTVICVENDEKNPKHLREGLLSKIKLPTGSEIRYEFEPHQYYENKNTTNYLSNFAPPGQVKDKEVQYYEDIGEYVFDFTNSPYERIFMLPSDSNNPGGVSYLQLWFGVNEYYYNPILDPDTPPFINVSFISGTQTAEGRTFPPGPNIFKVTGTGGRGVVYIKRIRYKSVPLPNYTTGNGVRIKKIEHYDNNILVPSQTRRYEYSLFDNPNQPSGVLHDLGDSRTVVYKNIKEIIGSSGYTQYHFRTLRDYPENILLDDILSTMLKYTNILQTGLLEKKETFNSTGTLTASETHEYEIMDRSASDANYRTFNSEGNLSTYILKGGFIKTHTRRDSLIQSNGSITKTDQYISESKHLNMIKRTAIESDGTVTETHIQYPFDIFLTDPHLYAAGLANIPLITETKRNGITISKSETKYEDTSHYFPTSQVSYLPDNLSQSVKNVSYDIYDANGNVVQYTELPGTGTGKSTTIIWGYHKTLPIAKIEGARVADIPAGLIAAIVNASNADADATLMQETATELALIAALNTFRTDAALKNYQITTYTYDPLIGVTNTIPPSGIMETYQYDSFNRLYRVRDANGVILKEYQYNYKD